MTEIIDRLTEENFLKFAAQNYDNPQCYSSEEFKEDLNRIKYLKRLLRKYLNGKPLKKRLILNHIMVLYNVFDLIPCARILFFRMEPDLYSPLKTFMWYLNILPDYVESVGFTKDIPINDSILKELKKEF